MTTPFETNQRTYYTREINRGLPYSGGDRIAPSDVAAAVSTLQSLTGGLDAAAAGFLSDFGASTQAAQSADAACRTIAFPNASTLHDPAARTGCGWWYVSDPTKQSIGAYGTRRGPMNPAMDTTYGTGRWIWDPAEAAGYEMMKRASQVQSCPDLVNSGTTDYAWCTTTNMAIPIDANSGTPLYPTQPRGDCPGGALVMASQGVAACSPPTNSAANYGYNQDNTSGCTEGNLSPQCVHTTLTGVNNPNAPGGLCNTSGYLATVLRSGNYASNDSTFNQVYGVMSRQFTLNPGTYASGQTTAAAVVADSQALANFANTGPVGRSRNAAANLCYGTPFDPCSYTAADTGPFDISCITQIAINTYGYAANAGLVTIGASYWNNATTFPTWGDVLSNLNKWKLAADNPPGPNNLGNPLTSTAPADIQAAYEFQKLAIFNVYGVTLPDVTLTCQTAT